MTIDAAPPYSPFQRVGDLVYVSGQIALHDGVVTGAGIGEQTAITMGNVERVLAEAGATLSMVRKVNAILTDRADFARFNAAYALVFTAGPRPARTTIIAQLPNAEALVEIEVIAELPAG